MTETDPDQYKERVQKSLNTYFNRELKKEQLEHDKATGRHKPKTRAASEFPYESWEQAKLATWLDRTGALWCHVANERNTGMRQGARLKAHGVKKGVPDILVFGVPAGCQYNGLAIELKRVKAAGSRASREQKEWLERLTAAGWAARVCYGHLEAIEWLESLGVRLRSAATHS
jgi:hypothetical protein